MLEALATAENVCMEEEAPADRLHVSAPVALLAGVVSRSRVLSIAVSTKIFYAKHNLYDHVKHGESKA
jgi:hypothetical protein